MFFTGLLSIVKYEEISKISGMAGIIETSGKNKKKAGEIQCENKI
jgi:hypothetical protein